MVVCVTYRIVRSVSDMCLMQIRDYFDTAGPGLLADDAQVVGQAVKVVKTLKKLDISFNKIGTRQNLLQEQQLKPTNS